MKGIEQILKSYAFSKRFCVQYALACALTVESNMEDKRSIEALRVTERWLKGEATETEMNEAAYAAAYAAHAAAYAAYAAASAASAAANAAYATNSAHAAAHATNSAYAAANAAAYASYTNTNKSFDYKALLLKMIKEELTEFERLMLGVEDENF